MIKKINLAYIFLVLLVIILIACAGFKGVSNMHAETAYQVYLDGKKIGLLYDIDELYDLIDEKQEEIKEKYEVDTVYPPTGLETVEIKTYNTNINTALEIYDILEEKEGFTIFGYTVTIDDGEEPIYIYILNKEDLEPALQNVAGAFIGTDELYAYINNNQSTVTDTGTTIKQVYFEEKITIKESYISVSENIITNESDLTKYLLFGTLEEQASYTVKDGDTVDIVAYNNKLSVEELLIANSNLTSVNTLLSVGQVLSIGLIDPLLTVVEEVEKIEDVEVTYDTVYEYDSTRYASQSYVKQEGSNGVSRYTEQIQYKNGEIMTLLVTNDTEIIASTDKIIVSGTKTSANYDFNYYPPATSSTDWGWPTTTPYLITSYFSYRWGKHHNGIDISGSGAGSPIYSATSGTVIAVYNSCSNVGYYGSTCGGGYGNYVKVQFGDYTITYAHIRQSITVSVGDTVSKGSLLGYMGNSGSSTGTHLHFQIDDASGNALDPCEVAFKC